MQNSRNELGLFAVPFLLYSYEKRNIVSQISVLRQTVVRRFFCAKKGESYDKSSHG